MVVNVANGFKDCVNYFSIFVKYERLKNCKKCCFFFTIVFFTLPDLQWEKLSIWFRDQRDVTWQFEKFIEDYQDYGH